MHRPADRESFVGQPHLLKIVKTAIKSAKTSHQPLGHMLLTGPSGHGKTTLARLIANDLGVRVHHVTAYALSKPAEMISLLNSLQTNDILFIDELHRLKPILEEVLYIAMEDFAIDMLMPDGKPLRLDLYPFTLIGATTRPEALTPPLKNRFVYKLHFLEYTDDEKKQILLRHLDRLNIEIENDILATEMCSYVTAVPREIGNLCIQLHARLIAHYGIEKTKVMPSQWKAFRQDLQLHQGWLTILHKVYLQILESFEGRPVGLKTIAISLWLHETAIEEDVEPLLLKLGRIEKTAKGRVLIT